MTSYKKWSEMHLKINFIRNLFYCLIDGLAEWSKAVDSGSIPKGRGFESLNHHFWKFIIKILLFCIFVESIL